MNFASHLFYEDSKLYFALPQLHRTQPQPPPLPPAKPGVMGGIHWQQPPLYIQSQQPPFPQAQPGVMGGIGEIEEIHGQLSWRETLQPGPTPGPCSDLNITVTFEGGGGGLAGGGPAGGELRELPLLKSSGPVDGGQGPGWVAPGGMISENPPSMPCPNCNKADFRTQTDLEVHYAQCANSLWTYETSSVGAFTCPIIKIQPLLESTVRDLYSAKLSNSLTTGYMYINIGWDPLVTKQQTKPRG